MKWFITYGDSKYKEAKEKILAQAKLTEEFDKVIGYSENDVSEELKHTKMFMTARGGGLWSWKPDIICKTMQEAENGDIIVYCDSGCTIQKTPEWKKYWELLEKYDVIAQRIRKRTDKWTRKEVIDFFPDIGKEWIKCYQYQATIIIIIISEFTRKFIKEWRDLMIAHQEFVIDVMDHERSSQHRSFKENRHDQAIYSALIYKYRNGENTKDKIYTQWEHVEDYDIFCKQAIRATRLRFGEKETKLLKLKRVCKRVVKDFFLKPFIYSPLQSYFGRKY